MHELKSDNKHIHWLMEMLVGKKGRVLRVNVCFGKLKKNSRWLIVIKKLNRSMEIEIKNYNKITKKIENKEKKNVSLTKKKSAAGLVVKTYRLHGNSEDSTEKLFINLILKFEELTNSLIKVQEIGGFPNPRVVHRRISHLRKKMSGVVFGISTSTIKNKKG